MPRGKLPLLCPLPAPLAKSDSACYAIQTPTPSMMKPRSILPAVGIALLLIASLFHYSRSETTVHGVTSTIDWDGAGLSAVILCLALWVVCRRIGRTIRLALSRAGLPAEIRLSTASTWVICCAVPFLAIGYQTVTTEGNITRTFGFGMSPLRLAVFALVVLVMWLVAAAQRLRELSDHMQREARETVSL